MRPPSLNLEGPATKRRELLALAEQVPGAWIGMKIAALLLLVEGQRPGWIAEVLGLTRMSLCRWIHAVNEQGVQSLVPQPKSGCQRRREFRLNWPVWNSWQERGLCRVRDGRD